MSTIVPLERERQLSGHLLFRGINERVRELYADTDGDVPYFFCECNDDACTAALQMPLAEFDALRDSSLYAVLPGHVARDDEVVGHGASYAIVYCDKPRVSSTRIAAR